MEIKSILGGLKKACSKVYDIISVPFDLYWKAKDYDRISQKYTNQVTENLKLRGSIEENQGHKQLAEDSSQKYKQLADEYQKLAEDSLKKAEERGALIDHLKKEKKGLLSLLNQVIDQTPHSLKEFLKEDPNYSKQSIMFVNSKGVILDYTNEFEKNFPGEDLIGSSYLDLLGKGHTNPEEIRKIKRFFNTYEEKEFDVEVKRKGKKVKFHVTKRPPVTLNLDLSSLGRGKSVNTIAFVPVSVKPVGKIRGALFRSRGLQEALEEHDREKKKIYLELVTKHSWTSKMIDKVEMESGYEGLKHKYFKLEDELKKR